MQQSPSHANACKEVVANVVRPNFELLYQYNDYLYVCYYFFMKCFVYFVTAVKTDAVGKHLHVKYELCFSDNE